MCAGKVMGPGGEAIKSLSERTGCSVVVEGKSPNAAFVPFRLVNYLAPGAAQISAAVAEVVELVCQEEKYEAGECSHHQQGPLPPPGSAARASAAALPMTVPARRAARLPAAPRLLLTAPSSLVAASLWSCFQPFNACPWHPPHTSPRPRRHPRADLGVLPHH